MPTISGGASAMRSDGVGVAPSEPARHDGDEVRLSHRRDGGAEVRDPDLVADIDAQPLQLIHHDRLLRIHAAHGRVRVGREIVDGQALGGQRMRARQHADEVLVEEGVSGRGGRERRSA